MYCVTPDDDDGIDDSFCSGSSLCNQCHKLQHYLLNVSNFFTPDIQLYFFPGLHYLPTNLVIQNVSNVSLIGSTANGRQTTIQCTGEYHIIMRNSHNVTIKHLIITKCGHNILPGVTVAMPPGAINTLFDLYTVQLNYCSFITIMNVKLMSRNDYDFLINLNTMGDSLFQDISSAGIYFVYHDDNTTENYRNVNVLIDNYLCNFYAAENGIKVFQKQLSFTVHLKIANIDLCNMLHLNVYSSPCSYYVIEICDFMCSNKIACEDHSFFSYSKEKFNDKAANNCIHKKSLIQFKNCHFVNIFRYRPTLTLIKVNSHFGMVHIVNCSFVNTKNVILIKISGSTYNSVIDMYQDITTLIKNTSFIMNVSPYNSLIIVSESVLSLEGPMLFIKAEIKTYYSGRALIESSNTIIHFHDYIEIFNCTSYAIFSDTLFLMLKESVTVNISHNNIILFVNGDHYIYKDVQPICMFQYCNDENLDTMFAKNVKLNYSVILKDNNWLFGSSNGLTQRINHCSWLMGSAFNVTIPGDVNQRFITFVDRTFAAKEKNLCYCSENGSIDCYKDQLGPIYPGETLNIMLAYPYSSYKIVELIVDVHDAKLPSTACKISSLQETKQIVTQTCTIVKFTILQVNSHYQWCELIFKIYDIQLLDSNDAFYIKFYPCPAGFTKIDGRCQCDPVLKSSLLAIDDCDINDQTISRPANSWISATTNNGTFTYLVSDNCPFDYCLPYPSHFKLSLTADLQCQFRRHNLLCGQCLDGLSTVFGSSHCLQCSNVNMFIIVPIAILGLLLVVLLFFLNLTVADGSINAFILYVNILSINSTIVFPLHDTASVVSYIFISISNLDMGIKMCFYDGMDDYAKMWLQLLFPLYLIVIAAILIITSRYSSKVQRLTARRALPVLATLFLLSYTKILRTVSSVLFSYSTIVHLPSNHSKLVWSVDANVNMLEIKFIILFIVCLVIFILLVPFNITLLFTRTLSRFRIVNYFKPLLDVYQGPFKIKFYYWTGLHLVIKAVFFGLSALDKNVNLLIGSMILFAIVAFVGYTCPYKNWYQNCNEMILLFNIHAQYVLILSSQSTIAINVMIALAAVQFIFIMIYHIFNYTPAEAIKNKMKHCVSALANIKFSKRSTANAINLHDISYRNRIPHITYDYSEYQEPLVGED